MATPTVQANECGEAEREEAHAEAQAAGLLEYRRDQVVFQLRTTAAKFATIAKDLDSSTASEDALLAAEQVVGSTLTEEALTVLKERYDKQVAALRPLVMHADNALREALAAGLSFKKAVGAAASAIGHSLRPVGETQAIASLTDGNGPWKTAQVIVGDSREISWRKVAESAKKAHGPFKDIA